jgi:SPX domain protein involved in polyphosphate accumulation
MILGDFINKFLVKISKQRCCHLNLEEDLKEHDLDGLGYASSWVRQFAEYYSKLSWLDGFAKINIIAVQKIIKKFDKIIFNE